MTHFLTGNSFDVEFFYISSFYIIVYGSILYIYHRTFRSNWSRFHAVLKGSGFVCLIALPIYGFSILDAAQLLLRGRDLGGARVHLSVDPPEGAVLPGDRCGVLCQELLLEDRMRFAEIVQSDRKASAGSLSMVRYEKRTDSAACSTHQDPTETANTEGTATSGLVVLEREFRAAVALGTCITYQIVEEPGAAVVVRTWPEAWHSAPIYLGESHTEHHEIFRRGEGLAVKQMLAESEAAWTSVLAFPPRIRRSDIPGEGLTYSTRLSYGAPPLEQLINQTLSLELNGRFDAPATALPQLIAALDHEEPEVRSALAKVIGAQGPSAAKAAPSLIVRLADPDETVADEARLALGRIGSAAVGPLTRALAHPRAQVRVGAVRALGAIGLEARAAGPALAKLLEREDSPRRAVVAWALGQLRWTEALPALLATLESPERELRDSAKFALARMGEAAVPGLMAKLDHEDLSVRVYAVEALGAIGPAAEQALTALRAGMGSEMALSYRWAIEQIEGPLQAP